jgi:hypothetical protein
MKCIEEFLFKDKNISTKPNMIFSRDKNIYLIDSIKIIFGNINEHLLFIPEYIFSYNNITNFNKEKELIYSIPITKYIKQRKCQLNNSNSQNLIDNNIPSEILGQFITLNNNSKIKIINNIFYYDKSYIIPFEIMKSIDEFLFKDKNISIKPNMIFSRDNNIYLIDSIKIIFGNINEQFLFIPEYIFSYKNKAAFDQEKEIINSIPISKYIKQRKCNQNYPDIQNLKDNKK